MAKHPCIETLDLMNPDDLLTFWHQHFNRSRKRAAELGFSGPSSIRRMRLLALYASNLATARNCEARDGKTDTSEMYHRIAQNIAAEFNELS